MNIFTEEQKFNQIWLKILLVFILVFTCIPLIIFINLEDAETNKEVFWILVFTNVLFVCLFLFLVAVLKLQTRIDNHGIHYGFYPIRKTLKTIPWREIKTSEVVTYSPLGDYGGWGYRISFRKGRALNVKGNKGIKIELQNNKKLLIGTQKPEAAKDAIIYYKK
ncbi:MAG: hypothetical protein H0X63_04750 [Flavobacteriales bacterium]|nr:hypothetical protein [Flavobacteriales bacterium]